MSLALLGTDEIVAIHAAAGGDAAGYNATLLDSAVQVAINLAAYGTPDLPALAAAYSWGVVRDRPFVGRNDETAAAVATGFLERNGLSVTADDAALTGAVVALSRQETGESDFAAWLRGHVEAR